MTVLCWNCQLTSLLSRGSGLHVLCVWPCPLKTRCPLRYNLPRNTKHMLLLAHGSPPIKPQATDTPPAPPGSVKSAASARCGPRLFPKSAVLTNLHGFARENITASLFLTLSDPLGFLIALIHSLKSSANSLRCLIKTSFTHIKKATRTNTHTHHASAKLPLGFAYVSRSDQKLFPFTQIGCEGSHRGSAPVMRSPVAT